MRSKNQTTFGIIEKCINDFSDVYGYAPTVYEIAENTGISKSTVQRYISQMRDDGTVEYSGHRSITSTKTKTQSVRVPVLGAISCGIPKYAEENIEEYVRLPVYLFGKGKFRMAQLTREFAGTLTKLISSSTTGPVSTPDITSVSSPRRWKRSELRSNRWQSRLIRSMSDTTVR